MRRAAKSDANQAGIVKRLRQIGVSVEVIGKPVDLLICHRGETAIAEVKNEDGKNRYTKAQLEFFQRWPGKIFTFRSPDDAVQQLLERWMT